ncbi:acyl-CoA desaturase [Amycolatopsis sp. PS_44_ISF1]|uniref:fatty acid desaturase family protein n=1 Tax=Amycolatopsis sp. PS_44_ISF1 TaxID=2974917 RepID=UPI0028E047D4|nr:acyl-CoA desaturase [Amycolatopsis sp. PS_44_ISF1]MDT8914173.1 acyl-CoA desaturase [Amycolatopsis sp. PS_44_ISF1]
MTTENLVQPAPAGAGSDFARLSRRIADAGLLTRRPGYYTFRITLVTALFAGGWVAFALLGDSWWQLAIAAFQAFMFGQIALLSHDLAHRQVFRTRRPTEIAGRIAGNLGVGMSYGWWMDKHTRHHANPNHEELDPDVDPDILVWSKDQARASRGVPRFIGRYQAFLLFPLLTLEGLNLHWSGIRAVAKPGLRGRWIEAVLLATHFVVYLSALFLVLPPGLALLFFAVHQGVWGVYMGSIFAPNHKGMPTLTGRPELDFLRKQVLTSRNVRGGAVIDVAMGGLNYQIEHHLFPSMPSVHLRRAQPIVQDYCTELGVPYRQTGLVDSYRQALTHLHETGAPLRKRS